MIFFFGDDKDNLLQTCNFLSLSEDNNKFVSFLCSDMRQNIMTNNSLSTNIETGNIFYNDFNTKENFYSFLLGQQDKLKQFILKRISIIISSKNTQVATCFRWPGVIYYQIKTKYLLYKFNDWIESMGAKNFLIRHTSKVRDEIGLQKIEEKDKQFLVEKTIAKIENHTL